MLVNTKCNGIKDFLQTSLGRLSVALINFYHFVNDNTFCI